MNKPQIFLTGLTLLMLSCKSQNTEGILTQPKMEAILKDIHIAESTISVRNIPIDSAKIYYYQMEKQILQSHQTDSASFHKSFKYYLSTGKDFEKMYSNLVDSLGLMESKE